MTIVTCDIVMVLRLWLRLLHLASGVFCTKDFFASSSSFIPLPSIASLVSSCLNCHLHLTYLCTPTYVRMPDARKLCSHEGQHKSESELHLIHKRFTLICIDPLSSSDDINVKSSVNVSFTNDRKTCPHSSENDV